MQEDEDRGRARRQGHVGAGRQLRRLAERQEGDHLADEREDGELAPQPGPAAGPEGSGQRGRDQERRRRHARRARARSRTGSKSARRDLDQEKRGAPEKRQEGQARIGRHQTRRCSEGRFCATIENAMYGKAARSCTDPLPRRRKRNLRRPRRACCPLWLARAGRCEAGFRLRRCRFSRGRRDIHRRERSPCGRQHRYSLGHRRGHFRDAISRRGRSRTHRTSCTSCARTASIYEGRNR